MHRLRAPTKLIPRAHNSNHEPSELLSRAPANIYPLTQSFQSSASLHINDNPRRETPVRKHNEDIPVVNQSAMHIRVNNWLWIIWRRHRKKNKNPCLGKTCTSFQFFENQNDSFPKMSQFATLKNDYVKIF